MLQGKKILVGVCGSIAAYKSALLIRLLVKEGAEVRVVMTPSAASFITPLTLATLAKHPVYSEYFNEANGTWHNHVELGLWADLMVLAPLSANTLGKLANGLCDNLLCAVYLSARCPVYVAPAMDLDMYAHASTQANLQALLSYGNRVIDAESGELASGLDGKGRMAEPEHIVQAIQAHFAAERGTLKGKRVIITAGPTYEPLDPVRFIGNHSSGKMGYAIAEVMAGYGAEVTLIAGPTSWPDPPGIKCVHVMSALEMHASALALFPTTDIAVLAAAVADYRPATVAEQKIKKSEDEFTLTLTKNPDIAKDLGSRKEVGQLLVGFALETNNGLENAQGKLEKKNLDFIVLNSPSDEGTGFGHDTNRITILARNTKPKEFELKSKKAIAQDIVNEITTYLDR
ncbi:MAG TPA: bifunctional phosphopantothenoylcysteine decarboxylase/phosphopantothenate--cysteine ligase CoaBC [Cytophagales bacterium]|nr:bifunctional phosphopantothenoylcysteine decarboxylase/phosphopantothenate--cysteine ligase CoaBC [Cytophagales bacterium]